MKYMEKKYQFTTTFPDQMHTMLNAAKRYVYAAFGVSEDRYGHYSSSFFSEPRDYRRGIVDRIVDLWEPPVHGYVTQDYYDFVDYMYKYVQHLRQEYDLESIYNNFRNMMLIDYSVASWRYVAYIFSQDDGMEYLRPKQGTGSLTFPDMLDSLPKLRQRVTEQSQRLMQRFGLGQSHRHSIVAKQAAFPSFGILSWELRSKSKKPLDLSYIRMIELNEFLDRAEGTQSLQDFLDNDTEYVEHVKNYTLRPLQYRSLLIQLLGSEKLPKFLQLDELSNNGVTVRKRLLDLTKQQYLELYQNIEKNPSILRNDAQSQMLKYADEFLEQFFDDEEVDKEELNILSLPEVQKKMFELFLKSDKETVLHASTNGTVYEAQHESFGGVYGLLQLFFHESQSQMLFDEKSCALFSALIGKDGKGLDDSSMLEIMYLIYALREPRHFAHKNTGLQTAEDVLTDMLVQKRLSSRAVVRFIVEAMKVEDKVPVIDEKSDSIGLLNDDTPIEWVISMFKTRKRALKQPRLVEQTKYLV